MKKISIVVPVYNEEENIQDFYRAVIKAMENISYDWEIIFIDDGSQDNTSALIHVLIEQDSRIKGIFLAHNFGHQIALTCGLDYADGNAVITMDGDLQHPPELIPALLEKWEKGYQIVQTVRLETEDISWFKDWTSRTYYKLFNAISDIKIKEGGSDFRLLDKKVVLTFRQFRERARFIRGIINSMGYKQTILEFRAHKRKAGKSKFTLKKMLAFALAGITTYSRFPLRLAFYAGTLLGSLSLLGLAHVFWSRWIENNTVPGWSTLACSVFLLSGVQLIVLGIVGEYIGRIFEEVKGRPLYWVKEIAQNKEV